MNVTLGIDPGYFGGVAVITEMRSIMANSMPLKTIKTINRLDNAKHRHEVDAARLVAMLSPYGFGRVIFAVVERVHSSPQMGVSSSFRFGEGYGVILGVLAALEIPIRYVEPSVWKVRMDLGRDKAKSVVMANSLFGLNLRRKDDGIAEALLLAHYGSQYLLPIDSKAIFK